MTATKQEVAEALAEARKRWGSTAYATADPTAGLYDLTGEPKFYVGRHAAAALPSLGLLATPAIEGVGNSWEAAFADADRRAK